MMKNLIKFKWVATTLLSLSVSVSAMAADKVLKVATWLPTTHSINSVFWENFAKEIDSRTEGRVAVEIEYGLAPPNGLLELVEYGGADFTWIYNGYFPGRFVTTKLLELPGYEGDAEAASVTHWRAQEKFFNQAKEFEGVELIGHMVHAPAVLSLQEEIENLEAAKGLKVRIPGGVANEIVKALELTPLLASVAKSYELISSGVADGVVLPADLIPGFRLYEAAPNVYTVPGGFYRGSLSVIMSPDALSGISEADEKAIRDYFGEQLSADGGRVWDMDSANGIAIQKEHGQVVALSAEDAKRVTAVAKLVKEEVLAEINARGVDGQAAYEFIFETMKSYQSKK